MPQAEEKKICPDSTLVWHGFWSDRSMNMDEF